MIASIALTLWPVVGIIWFRTLSLPVALCVTIIGGFLLLPEQVGLNLPVLPTLDKHSIPVLTAFILTALALRQDKHGTQVIPGWLPRNGVVLSLSVLLFIGAFGTVLTNQDSLVYGPRFLQSMRIYDGFSFSLTIVIALIPMALARRVLATPEAQKALLTVLVVSALFYTIPVLWEVRMSPQLHRQIYGFFQHGFVQQIRGDGFRSMVFVNHGLTLSIFLSLAVLSAATMMRVAERSQRTKWCVAVVWLMIVLVLNKSLGALIITIVFLPIVLFLRPRAQVWIAASVAAVVMIYPLLRSADLVPTDRILSFAESIDTKRARSLQVRFENENILLEKARERPVFGWGGWSRNRVYAPNGRDISITDGEWVIHFGIGGWSRYVGFFGLLCWPLVALLLSKRNRVDPVCTMLALVLCAKLIDLIPNAGTLPYIWLIVGSLLGRLEITLKDTSSQDQDIARQAQTAIGSRHPARYPAFDDAFRKRVPKGEVLYTRAGNTKDRRLQ